jgi:hypothetical protein
LAWQTPASAYEGAPVLALEPYSLADGELVAALQQRELFPPDAAPDPAQRSLRSETGEITIDGPRDRLVLDTPRTAGGYARAGVVVEAPKGGVTVSIEGSDATVWIRTPSAKVAACS